MTSARRKRLTTQQSIERAHPGVTVPLGNYIAVTAAGICTSGEFGTAEIAWAVKVQAMLANGAESAKVEARTAPR